MFKKYRLVVAACVVGLGIGVTTQTADASASMGGESQPQQQEGNSNYQSMQDFLQECFANWNINWDWQEQTDAPAAPEQEQTDAPGDVTQPEQETTPEVEETPQEDKTEQEDTSELHAFETEVVELTNVEREKNGLAPLEIDGELSKVAREKSQDMQVNNYFDHNSPTYGSPFDMMESFGIDYRAAGENIAKGQGSPEEVVNAWMNSEGHRANILNGDFTHIGVGYIENGNVWTQQFIGK